MSCTDEPSALNVNNHVPIGPLRPGASVFHVPTMGDCLDPQPHRAAARSSVGHRDDLNNGLGMREGQI